MSLLSNIVTSQFTKSERWLKLYRIIHHLFLKEEFVHIVDYNLMVTQMNAKIAMVETNANASMAAMVAACNAAIIGHTHMAPQAPTGTLPTSPGIPVVPAVVVPAPPVPPVQPVTTAMQAADAALMATGPATAPLADGISPDELNANSTIIADIGF